MKSIRKWLLAGLLVCAPTAITFWFLNWVVGLLDQTLLILPNHWRPDQLFEFHIPGFGVLLALTILLVIGAIASNFAGRRLLAWWHSLVDRIPFVGSIYNGVKQVSDTLLADGGKAFRKTVLIQWPRDGVWTIAFVTGVPGGDVGKYLHADYLSVYVPTTPNPTGGYFVMLPRSECIELDMSVDDALKYIVSMGVVAPESRSPAQRRDTHVPSDESL